MADIDISETLARCLRKGLSSPTFTPPPGIGGLMCDLLYDPMDCSPPDSSIHGILQARILEWVAMPSSRGSSGPRD